MAAPDPAPVARLGIRGVVATRAGTAAARISRRLGRGDGTVIGGRVSLVVDPNVLARLGAGRWSALVSGTNGKTTTTRLLSAALATGGPVVTNPQGSNLPPGLVAGLSRAAPGARAALEVDEAWLGIAASSLVPRTMTLLNLTRDQLDRVAEVRRLSERWHEVVGSNPQAHIVANADDPLVAWAASAAEGRCTWVGAGQPWRDDAAGCARCGGRIRWSGPEWRCDACGLARPASRTRARTRARSARCRHRADPCVAAHHLRSWDRRRARLARLGRCSR